MKPSETGIIMDILTAAYPNFYKGQNNKDRLNTMKLWAEMFSGYDVALVAAAVKSLIETDEKGFPPHIGAVKAKIRLLTAREEMTEAEAWGIVSKAIRNGTYGSQEEFEKLPPNLKRIVGSPNMLREWARMDSDTVHSVVSSNFQRSYRAVSAREREIAKLPQDVLEIVQKIGSGREKEPLPEKKTVEELPPPKRIVPEWMRQENQQTAQKRSREEVIAALRDGDAGSADRPCQPEGGARWT